MVIIMTEKTTPTARHAGLLPAEPRACARQVGHYGMEQGFYYMKHLYERHCSMA